MDDALTKEALRLLGQTLQLLVTEAGAKPSAEETLKVKMGDVSHQLHEAVVATFEISKAFADDKEAQRFWFSLGRDINAARWKIIDRYFPMPMPRSGAPAE